MAFAKSYVYPFGVGFDGPVMPPPMKQLGFGKDETIISRNGLEKCILNDSFLELNLGTQTTRQGNTSLDEKDGNVSRNFDLNGVVKDSNRNVIGNEWSNVSRRKKKAPKETNIKTKDLVEKKLTVRNSQFRKNPQDYASSIRVMPAPHSLKDLLLSSGWIIVSQEGFGDPVYVSPSGSAFGSLPLALEDFSRSASKFREKEWDLSPSMNNQGLSNNFDLSYPSLFGNFGPSSGNVVKGIQKRKRGPRKRANIFARPAESVMLMDSLTGAKDVDKAVAPCIVDEKAKSCIKDECLSIETKNSDCSSMPIIKNDQDTHIDIHRDGESVGVRRSARINGKHVSIDCEFMEMWADEDFLKSYEIIVDEPAKKAEEKPMIATLEVENTEDRVSTVGNKLLKQGTGNIADYQKHVNCNSRSKRSNVDHVVKPPVSDKCSPSLKKTGVKTPDSGKRSMSSASKRKSVCVGNLNGKKKKKRSGGCGLMVKRTGKDDYQEEISSKTKLSVLSWLVDAGILVENQKVVYKINNRKGNTLRGWVNRGGIWCNCCKKVVSLLEFEAHAGSNLRQPWNNTFVISGKSLMQYQIEAWEKEKKQRKIGFQTVGVGDIDPSDDTCGICADGGNLICCDGCPSTFHPDCVMLKALPEDSWYCPYCTCAFCMVAEHGHNKANATLILPSCNQCGRKYHKECAWGNDKHEIGSESFSFCSKDCKKVAAGLSNMLGIRNLIGGGFSWTLLRRHDEDEGISSHQRLSFIVESNVKLSLALSVLEECFVPLVDPRTGLDMICQAVYNCGSNFCRLNYEGFYTVILEKEEDIISVASLRLHGTHLAEMPFIGTRPIYRRQGMCRRLLMAIEEILSSLYVQKLIIPAIPDLLETWMTSFSFKPLEFYHKNEIRNLNMMLFAETTLLQKPICNSGTKVDRES